jgi:hypothetical protein
VPTSRQAVDGALGWIDVVIKGIEVFEASEAVDQLHQPHAVAFLHHHPRPEPTIVARPSVAEHHEHGGVHALITQAAAEHALEVVGLDVLPVDGLHRQN